MSSLVSLLFPMLIMFGIFYVLLIRPQQKERKRLEEIVSNLKKNDKIILFSGVIAIVESINEEKNTLIVSSEGNKFLIVKDAIKGMADES